MASGLRINLYKSKLIGVGVEMGIVHEVAGLLGCDAAKIPLLYLGVTVGGNMNRVESWKPLIDKFQARLSRWKSKVTLGWWPVNSFEGGNG